MSTDMNEFEALTRDLMARWPENRIAPGLGRIGTLCGLLGDPQDSMKVIMVTGTNGKGSVSIMIDALLRSAGLRTGRFTSPHLTSVTERISIDGRPLTEDEFVAAWQDIAPYVEMVDQQQIDGVDMTFFEVVTAMAYAAFADAPVDVAIMEVGLGGTWDATNIADADVAVVLPVDLDHTHILGSTVTEIAAEKAGIIKAGGRAVLAGQHADAAAVLFARCIEVGVEPMREGLDFAVLERVPGVGGQVIRLDTATGPVSNLFLPAHGDKMASNAAVAVAAVEALLAGNPIGEEVINDGFARIRLPGRLELVRERIVLDGAHNPAAARASAEAMAEAYSFEPLIGVLAIMRDKDADEVLRVWEPVLAQLICTETSSTDRCLPAAELAELAEGIFGAGRVSLQPQMADAIEQATAASEDELGQGGVLITGSVIAVGEARALLVEDEPDPEFDGDGEAAGDGEEPELT